jgi:hypothetical protein
LDTTMQNVEKTWALNQHSFYAEILTDRYLCRSVYCCYIKLWIQISNPAYWYCTMQIVSAAGLLVPEGSIRPVVSVLKEL